MPLITPLKKDEAPAEVREKLEGIEEAFGMLPNAAGVLANSNCSLDMSMKMEEALSQGELNETH